MKLSNICVLAAALVMGISPSMYGEDIAAPPKLPKGAVAAQGDVVVTMPEIDAAAQKIPEKDRAGFFDSPKRIQSTISNLLVTKQLAEQARKEKLDRDAGVKARMQLATDDALASAQLEHFQKSLKVPDFEQLAQEYYSAHKDQFVEPGDIVVQHVLVATKSKERSEADAKSRIDIVEAAAKAHPERFDALVKEYSDDPSAEKNNGTINDAASAKMVKPFAAAAKALNTPGEISPVVKTNFGFHVLKLISKKPDEARPFADVKKELVTKLKNNFMDQQLSEYTGAMRGKPLAADPDLVASLRRRYAPADFQSPEDAQQAAEAATKPGEQGGGSTEPQH